MKVILMKGAPEQVLNFCYPPTHTNRIYWTEQANQRAQNGMRVLALAYRIVSNDYTFQNNPLHSANNNPEGSSNWFTMSSLLGIIDPPRPEAIEAIKDAKLAGIRVKMITGDHPVTALAIGKILGLNITNNKAITGIELNEIILQSMNKFDEIIRNNDIFARTTPEHKLKIVESLRRQNFICSMTGDGVNDAPALKAANIGVAMGITGTDVAKDAANMIITDDNFATIVDAIRIGRCTYTNLIKIIAFVLPTNSGQAFCIIISLIINLPIPITALQILWVNMITSVTLGIVLAFDAPTNSILTESTPRNPNKPIFGKLLIWRILLVTIYLVLVVLGIYQWEKQRSKSHQYIRTCCVNALVVAQIGYLFNCRNLRKISSTSGYLSGNPTLYIGILAILACQMLFTYAPGIRYIFHTEEIDLISWGKILLLGAAVFCAVEIDKLINSFRRGKCR